jgi:hypothetical protein
MNKFVFAAIMGTIVAILIALALIGYLSGRWESQGTASSLRTEPVHALNALGGSVLASSP